MNSMTFSPSTTRTAFLVGATTVALVASLQSGGKSLISSLHPPHPSAATADSQVQVHKEIGTFAKLAKDLKPSVVNIMVEKVAQRRQIDMRQMFPGMGEDEEMPQAEQPKAKGQGSGVIISSDGYIMTNNHVVSDATDVRVTLADGRELPAKVIGTDPKTDVALVKVDGTDLPAATLGDSEALDVGDWVMAIGNPFGLDATVTVGVLSGKGRVIGAGPYDDFLQTDASINPGNSGGPLFNTAGQVVGINTAIIKSGQGIGFSIPINLAKDITDQLKLTGHVTRGFLGLGTQPLTPKLKTALKLPEGTKGALIAQVVGDGPAAAGGAQIQDVITSLNGRPVTSDRDLLAQAARLPVGKDAVITVLREGREVSLTLRITERPDDKVSMAPAGNDLKVAPVQGQQETLGIGLEPLSNDIAAELRTNDLKGVVVAQVRPNSLAQKAGLQPGDIIRKVNDKRVESVDAFVSTLRDERKSTSLAFLVERQGNTQFVVIGS